MKKILFRFWETVTNEYGYSTNVELYIEVPHSDVENGIIKSGYRVTQGKVSAEIEAGTPLMSLVNNIICFDADNYYQTRKAVDEGFEKELDAQKLIFGSNLWSLYYGSDCDHPEIENSLSAYERISRRFTLG